MTNAEFLPNFQDQLLSELRGINCRLDGLETKVGKLETDVNQLKVDVHELKSDVRDRKVELHAYQKGLDGIVPMAIAIIITTGTVILVGSWVPSVSQTGRLAAP